MTPFNRIWTHFTMPITLFIISLGVFLGGDTVVGTQIMALSAFLFVVGYDIASSTMEIFYLEMKVQELEKNSIK